MKKQQKYFPLNNIRLGSYLPVFTIAAVSFILYFSETYHPSWNFKWQGISIEVRDTVKVLATQGAIYDRIVGYAGKTKPAGYRQRWFLKNATTKELQKLVTYPNPVVKTLAYEGLLKRKSQNHFKILKEVLSDTTYVGYLSGCIGDKMEMREYLVEHRFHLDIIATTSPPPPGLKSGIDLSSEEIKELQNIYQKNRPLSDR